MASLTAHLGAALDDGEFDTTKFFKSWFDDGRHMFFLFKKNLKVTNIQYAELFSLLRTYVQPEDRTQQRLEFLSGSDFSAMVQELVEPFMAKLSPQDALEAINRLYAPLLCRLVVVDTFYGSCSVHLPPGLVADLVSICGYAGYIHSCGDAHLVRNISKARVDEVIDALGRRAEHLAPPQRLFFLVYAHEDFTPFDRDDHPEDHQHGLDDVKVHLDKYFIGGSALVEVLSQVEEALGDRILIPNPGDYRHHAELLDTMGGELSNAIWMITDRGIRDGRPSDERYVAIYEQKYKNENPFHVFDENMPAWVDHTTLPNTLADAMLNVTRYAWPTNRRVAVVDPFVGSGTTWLSAAKFAEAEAKCGDALPISADLVRDNLDLITRGRGELDQLVETLDGLHVALSSDGAADSAGFLLGPSTEMETAYNRARGLVLEHLESRRLWSAAFLAEFRSIDELTRIAFYIGLRAGVRHLNAFRRRAESWVDGYLLELSVLRRQLSRLQDIRKHGGSTVGDAPSRLRVTKRVSYSEVVSIDYDQYRSMLGAIVVRHHDVARDPLPSADVVLADPPYGFNTEEDVVALASLYRAFCQKAVDAALPNGQLVICLADRSFTGRRSPFFTHKEYLVGELHAVAFDRDVELVEGDEALAGSPGLFRPPYYWESGRALRRAVLHYRIR